LQSKKHFEQRISPLHGIEIEGSDELENASDSICVNCEGNSNEIDESDLQHEKHEKPSI
jgi:hypothetical protein